MWNHLDSRFVSTPRSSGINSKNCESICESTTLNTSKHLKCSDKFSINHNKFSFNRHNNCNSKYLRIEYTIIRSVLNKVIFLENYLYMNNIDLFFLTETWLTPKANDAIVCPSNFNIIRNDRKSRGVAVLCRNSLEVYKVKKDLISINNTNFEYICIDIIKNIYKNKNFLCLPSPTVCKLFTDC